MCEQVGINTDQAANRQAVALADFLEAEMSKYPEKPSVMVDVFAPDKRKIVWKKLNHY